MADYKHIIPFIRNAEGGWCNVPGDSGGETNAGITYKVWCSIFGTEEHDRFMAMAPEDWTTIFRTLYWNAILGDMINSQRIADLLVDWVWGSGKHYPELDVQEILNLSFSEHLVEDGDFGPATIAAINAVNENDLWLKLVDRRVQYLKDVVASNPVDQKFLAGWYARLNNLEAFEKLNPM